MPGSLKIPTVALCDRVILTVAEVCALTGWSQTTIYKLIKSGELKSFRRRRAYRITRADLNAYLVALPRVYPRETVGGKVVWSEKPPNDGH